GRLGASLGSRLRASLGGRLASCPGARSCRPSERERGGPMRRRNLGTLALFALGLGLGTGFARAHHAWLCDGETAYHWPTRTVGFAQPVVEGGPVARRARDYIRV